MWMRSLLLIFPFARWAKESLGCSGNCPGSHSTFLAELGFLAAELVHWKAVLWVLQTPWEQVPSPFCVPAPQASCSAEVHTPKPVHKPLSDHWRPVFCAEKSRNTFHSSMSSPEAKDLNLPAGSPQPQHPRKKAGGSEVATLPCHPPAAAPSCSSHGERSCTSSFLHPHFRKIRLNIAKCAPMSQLRAGRTATFHIRKLGWGVGGWGSTWFTGEKLPFLLLWFQKDLLQDPTGLWGVLKVWQSR